MLQQAHNRHIGSTIAIIGSSPTASRYDGQCDVSIAVNGAALLGPRFDYFLCGDRDAHEQEWFAVNSANVRIIARLVASMDKILYPTDRYPDLRRRSVPSHEQRKVRNLPGPVDPHLLFSYRWFKENRLSSSQNYLMFGGTISCCAVQLAYLMGAECIKLYGCSFTHRGGHYFYRAKKNGLVRNSQREVMGKLISEVQAAGVRVVAVGPTRLTKVDYE